MLEIHGAQKGPGRLQKKKINKTSIRVSKRLYFYFKELQLFKKITISKTVLYISEKYNQRTTKSRQKPHERKRKMKPEKEKIGEERNSMRNET